MVSDNRLRGLIRRDLGLSDTERVADGTMNAEISRMRTEIPSKAGDDALRYLVALRCWPLARGERRIPVDHPRTLSSLRRESFSDENPRYWQRKLNKTLSDYGL